MTLLLLLRRMVTNPKLATLAAGFQTLTGSVYWHNKLWAPANGKLPGYADANPAEAQIVQSYVAAVAAGGTPAAPTVTTAFGQGLVQIVQGGYQ